MRLRHALVVLAALLAGCSSRGQDLDASIPWPECPDGGVVHGDRCVDPAGLAPCDLIESRGGCPLGFHCDPEVGTCVEGVACGEGFCAPGEACVGGLCTCAGSACPEGEICAPISLDEEEDVVVYACVPPEHDGDGDGHAAGDLDGDGRPDDCDDLDPAIGPGAEEVCDGVDNDCDGLVDEGFDADGDGYTSCGGPFVAPDCDDGDPSVHPGAVDLCALEPDGSHVETDCDPSASSCPAGSVCCPGVAGCVNVGGNRHNCGACGVVCPAGEFCIVGTCRASTGEFVPDPAEGVVEIPADSGTSNHPEVAFNWIGRTNWFSWRSGRSRNWFLFPYWELDYGIAWVQQVGDRGLLMFTGRHFVSTPIAPLSRVAGAVDRFLSPLRSLTWYDTVLVDVLEGEDTIPALAPAGGLGYGLAWSDGGLGSSQVFFAAIGEYGAPTGWSQQLTMGRGEHLYPRLAWGPYYYFMGASYGLVYQRQDGDDVQVYFQPVQGYWSWWAPFGLGVRVSDDPEGAFTPDVAWSPFGYGVVWQGAAENDLYFALMSPFGGQLVRPQRVTTDNSVAPWRPSICWNEDAGEFAVAYQGTSPPDDNQDIYFVRISPFGARLGAPVRLTVDRELQRHPDMAWTGDGYGVTWYDRQSGTNEIAFVLVDPDGGILDGPTMLTDHPSGGEATNVAITYGSAFDGFGGTVFGLAGWAAGELLGNGEFALVWRDEPSAGADPRVRFLRLPRTD